MTMYPPAPYARLSPEAYRAVVAAMQVAYADLARRWGVDAVGRALPRRVCRLDGQTVVLAGHWYVVRDGARYVCRLTDAPPENRHRPSVDVLFRSAARYAGGNAVGVIMTGMGDDGSRGMKEMHEAKAWTIAQDEDSCIVFGMPNEAIKLGGVDIVLPLDRIAAEVLRSAR